MYKSPAFLGFHNRALKIKIATILLVACVVSSCGKKNEESVSKNEEVGFEVNELLLGETYADSLTGFAIKIPKNWINVLDFNDEKISSKFRELIDQEGKVVFLDTASQSSLLISKVSKKELQQLNSSKDSLFNKNKNWESIIKSQFTVNGLRAYQFLAQNKELINFKLIFIAGTKNPFQIDFVLSRHSYLSEVKKVESSIGSIKKYL
jgi:hypothetical protein